MVAEKFVLSLESCLQRGIWDVPEMLPGCPGLWGRSKSLCVRSRSGTLALKTGHFSKKIGRFSKTQKRIY